MNSIYYLSYASVLFEIAKKQKKLEKYTQDAQLLFNTFHHNKDLQQFIANTSIPVVHRKKIFMKLFHKKLDNHFIYFIWSVIDFKRSRNIEKILKVFLKMAHQSLGILFVKITSAVRLTPSQKQKINLSIGQYFHNKKIYIHNIVDSSIIGGLKIESGSTLIDGTLKNKLHLMKQESYKSIHSGEIMEGEYGI